MFRTLGKPWFKKQGCTKQWWCAGALALLMGGVGAAQPVVTLRCWPTQSCLRLDGTPKIGTSIRPAPESITVHLPLAVAGRGVTALKVQLIADARGRVDLHHLSAMLVRSARFSRSASRMKTLIGYQCLRLPAQGPQAAFTCRRVR